MSWAEDVMAAQNRALAQALPGVQAELAQAAVDRETSATRLADMAAVQEAILDTLDALTGGTQ